jgi:CRP-like cAMP-binding protein
MAQDKTKLWYLKNIATFNNLNDEEVRMIDQHAIMQKIKKGDNLYLQGSSDKNVYILKKGVVKITSLTPQGNEIILDIFKEGSIFGEIASAEPEERNESAQVVEDGLICIIKNADFEQLMQRLPRFSIQISKIIGFRKCKVENKLIDLLFSTVEQRIAKTFLNLLDDFGVPHDDGYLLKIKLTHRDYASLIASTRETVTATFSKLRAEGLIDFEGKYVIIKSVKGLRTIAK